MAAQDEGSCCVTLKVAAPFLFSKPCSSWSTQITLLSIRTEDSLVPESVSDGCDFTALRQPWNGLHGACRQITEAQVRSPALCLVRLWRNRHCLRWLRHLGSGGAARS